MNEPSRIRQPSILLASASPRRRELLERLGWSVIVQPIVIDECEQKTESPEQYIERMVKEKLDASRVLPWVDHAIARLVADTIVVFEEPGYGSMLLHKPENEAQARDMLECLSRRTHQVITRFALLSAQGELHEQSVVSYVTMRAIEAYEKEDYLRSGEWRDKAGGYAIQGRAGAFISRIEGSYYAIMGLPICEVTQVLHRWLHSA